MAAKLANGRPRTASAVSVTSAFEQVQVVGVHGPPHPEDRDDDGQSHADFGHRDRDDEQREDQPGQVGLEARERHEVDVDRVQHQLDAEQDADGIPPRQHTEEPDGEDERGVQQEEDHRVGHEGAGERKDGVEEVGGEHDTQAPAEQGQGHQPEHQGLERHALPSLLSARAAFGGACMSRSLLPVAHEGGNAQPSQCNRSLSSSISRRSLVARSKVLSMMMASVGHTCTHSSQNSQAYSSSVKVLAKFRFSALSISTLMTWGGQMYSHSRQPMQASWPVSFA